MDEVAKGRAVFVIDGRVRGEACAFSRVFSFERVGKGEHDFLIFERIQEGDVILIINDDNREDRA